MLKSREVRYIKGVGPKKAELFNKVGVSNIEDLLYYLPRRYEDRSKIVSMKDLRPGEAQAVVGEVLKTNVFTAKTGTSIFEMTVGAEEKKISAVWYNQPFMEKTFSKGQKVLLYGKVELQKHLQITHPVFEIIEESSSVESLEIGRIVPVYPLTENLKQKYMRKIIYQVIDSCLPEVREYLPTAVRARRKLVDAGFAIKNIHFPSSFEMLEKAYKRLVFEEFFILQMVMTLRRKRTRTKGVKHDIREDLSGSFEELFDFEFTGEQKKCIKEIEKDMSSDRSMYRLLQGDVGSGKTVVSMYAFLLTVKNGHQAAMMVPTEVLARQHYVTISKTFMPLGLNVRLLVSGIDSDSRSKIREEIKRGEVDIVIGTHSLIQEGVEYKDLGLVVIDEQHKFGVDQRKELQNKGKVPDTLFMTATPIPRSLILTVFGDMDVSYLKEKPAGRDAVSTYCVGEEKREAVYGFIREEIAKGRQAFIVCPRIKSTGSEELRSVEDMYKELQDNVFKDIKVGLMHGQMKAEEKKKTMKDFCDGKYKILLSTTVIEVGVDISNATVMMIEHAERYGLAQLHQLRGRIGRGKYESYCFLMGETKTDAAYQRLSVMIDTDDGFEIAEKDLDIRGPGEFLGTRQSGLPELKVGNISKDFKIMEEAREEALNIVEEDPCLAEERNRSIRQHLISRFRGKKIFG